MLFLLFWDKSCIRIDVEMTMHECMGYETEARAVAW
jgi:hypothetical protein